MFKRVCASALAVWTLIFSCLYPLQANAATYSAASNLSGKAWFVPATSTGAAGLPIVAAAATALGRANPWVAAITIGTPLMQFLLEKQGGGNIAVRGRSSPKASGGTPPEIGNYMWRWTWGSQMGENFPSCDAAVNAGAAAQGGTLTSSGCPNPDGGQFCAVLGDGLNRCYGGFSRRCSAGYQMWGDGKCHLYDPASVLDTSDGVATFQPKADGTGLEPDPKDPDTTTIPSDSIINAPYTYSKDEYGNPTSVSITPSATGFKIDQRVQTTNGGQTATTINTITVNNDGTVVATNSTTVPGGIETASPTATPLSSGPSIQFPDDYNREATQQQIRNEAKTDRENAEAKAASEKAKVDSAVAAAGQAGPGGRWDIPGLHIPTKDDYQAPSVDGVAGAMPSGNDGCEALNLTIFGRAITLDFCPLVAIGRPIVNWATMLFAVIATYQFVLGRREET